MKAIVFDTHEYDRVSLEDANAGRHALTFLKPRLDLTTAPLAQGYEAVIAFVNDQLDAPALHRLAEGGVRFIALRCAGHNNLDVEAAEQIGIQVASVPSYTPHAVAEHVFALLLSMIRQIPRANARVRDGNFSVEGLVGFSLHGRVFGVIGLGQIGQAVALIARGFGCRILAYDPMAKNLDSVESVSLAALLTASDVISIHAPLTPDTFHMFDASRLALLRPRAILINTSRGALIDTTALIDCLRQARIGGVCLDVYEQEAGVFYNDLSDQILTDDALARLLTFRNVLITSHMGFLTREALREIADTTVASLSAFEAGTPSPHLLTHH